MKAFSFETFHARGANRTAWEACVAIASGDAKPGVVLLLAGPSGSGKTHLLWSTVKRLREAPSRTGIALLMANEFPDKVRDLIEDPSPISHGRPAVLLVDQLEQFEPLRDDLEAVIAVFHEHGHTIVLASREPVADLRFFSNTFREWLAQQSTLQLDREPVLPPPPQPAPPPKAALPDDLALLQRTNARLREAEAEAEAALAEQARLQGLLMARRGLEEEVERMAAERDAARAESAEVQAALQEFGAALEAAESAQLGRAQALEQRCRELADQVLAIGAITTPGAETEAWAAERAALEESRKRSEQSLRDARLQVEHAEILLQRALAEQERLRSATTDTHGRFANLEQELERARVQCRIYAAELDAARAGADREHAATEERAARLGHEVDQLHAMLDLARASARTAAREADDAHTAATLQAAQLQATLQRLDAALVPTPPPADTPQDHQTSFLDAGIFEFLPTLEDSEEEGANGRPAASPDVQSTPVEQQS